MVSAMFSKTIRQTVVPAIGLGTFDLVGNEAIETISQAVEFGYRHFDTAARYGNESDVGEGLRRSELPRGRLFITTKVWFTDCSPHTILEAVNTSLTNLGLGQVDLLLLHWPPPEGRIREPIEALNKSLAAGQTRHIGVSNFPPTMLLEALEYGDIFCNQVEFHPYLNQEKLLHIASEHDLLLTGYAPLAIGQVSTDPVIREIGDRHGKTPAQVCLRWLIDHEQVVVVPKTKSPNRLKENNSLQGFTLTDEDTRAINALARGLRIYDEEWVADWEDDSRKNGPPIRSTTMN